MWYLTALALAIEPPERTHDITTDDLFSLASVRGLAISDDGRVAVYTESRWHDGHDERLSSLWRVATDGRTPPERLTFGPHGLWSPTVTPDGAHVLFLSNRKRGGQDKAPYDGSTQVWRMAIDGGEPTPITAVEDGISRYRLAAGALWYATEDAKKRDDAFKKLRKSHSEPEYGHAAATTHALWRLDIETWRAHEVLEGDRTIVDFEVSPDGAQVALMTSPDSELIWGEGWSRVDILTVATGDVETLPDTQWRADGPSPYGWLEELAWSPDGQQLAYSVGYDGYPTEIYLASLDDGAHTTTTHVDVPDPATVLGNLGWRPRRDDLCFTAAHRARIRLVCANPRGGVSILTPEDDAIIWDWDVSANGKELITARGGLDHVGDLYAETPRGPQRLTRSNPQIDTWKLPQIQIVSWTGPDGERVEGILELPHDWTPEDGPLPTVLHLHGGPTWSTPYQFSFRGYGQTTFSSRGWALFSPNYRGSIGYGDAFLEQLIGRENDIEVADILAGVDHLIAQGISHPDQLAVMGWSNGGYLTNCLISQTDRFAAASSGAGVFDQTLQWAMEDTPGHVINYMEGLPWEQVEAVRTASPLFAADQISTPTVIHVGKGDPRVPAAHSQALFRALSVYLDVPTELLVYPNTGHGLWKRSHKEAKLAWDIAWFDHYVLGTDDEPDEATSPDAGPVQAE